jgi:hypothetical protein
MDCFSLNAWTDAESSGWVYFTVRMGLKDFRRDGFISKSKAPSYRRHLSVIVT